MVIGYTTDQDESERIRGEGLRERDERLPSGCVLLNMIVGYHFFIL